MENRSASVMATSSKRARVGETSSEGATPPVFEGDSDPEGMSSSEESELDRLLAYESGNSR